MPSTLTTATTGRPGPVLPPVGALRPLDLDDVHLNPVGYWGSWQQTNQSAILEHCYLWMGRVGWIANFQAAADGRLPGDRRGRLFSDSDVYKLLEAMSWEHGRTGDPALDATIRDLVATIGRAQDPDGYLNTAFGRQGQPSRYSDLEWGHELYGYGHLLQAAVARSRTSGPDELEQIARRVADHVCHTFGPDGLDGICGHPEIELGLVEFARLTGESRYRAQAALFVERRGHGRLADIEFGSAYFQDDTPVRDATVLRGHAVRALYLAAGAVDLAVDLGDEDLIAAVERQWEATVARRTYITGGMGSHHQDESFGDDFELPNDRAYCETCAGVASVMLSWRLLLATGRPRYAELIERTLHNVVATSPGRDGRSFFYANTLHQRVPGAPPAPDEQSRRASASQRSPWFEVSCCPTNVARTFAALGAYVATATDDAVQIHLYTGGTIRTRIAAGPVELEVTTGYPTQGAVQVVVREAPDAPWKLGLRVPAWAHGTSATRDGEPVVVSGPTFTVPGGPAGTVIALDLPVIPRFTFPDQRIDAARGTVAVECGPLVMCLESLDLSDRSPDDFVVDTTVTPRVQDGRVVVEGWLRPVPDLDWPYGNQITAAASERRVTVPLTPYSEWGERAPGTMRVWLRAGSAA